MIEEGSAPPTAGLGATPGSEHLSGLREPYLRLLAQENGLTFHKLRSPAALSKALRDPAPGAAGARSAPTCACCWRRWPSCCCSCRMS